MSDDVSCVFWEKTKTPKRLSYHATDPVGKRHWPKFALALRSSGQDSFFVFFAAKEGLIPKWPCEDSSRSQACTTTPASTACRSEDKSSTMQTLPRLAQPPRRARVSPAVRAWHQSITGEWGLLCTSSRACSALFSNLEPRPLSAALCRSSVVHCRARLDGWDVWRCSFLTQVFFFFSKNF